MTIMPDRDDEIDHGVPRLLPVGEKILLTKREAAGLLSISERTLSTLVATKAVPVVRINKRVLFRRAALEEWALRREENSEDSECPASPTAETAAS